MFGCCPRHQVRTLVPERGDPTTKIGLFVEILASGVFILAQPDLEQTAQAEIILSPTIKLCIR